jgi:hypothetical protein
MHPGPSLGFVTYLEYRPLRFVAPSSITTNLRILITAGALMRSAFGLFSIAASRPGRALPNVPGRREIEGALQGIVRNDVLRDPPRFPLPRPMI